MNFSKNDGPKKGEYKIRPYTFPDGKTLSKYFLIIFLFPLFLLLNSCASNPAANHSSLLFPISNHPEQTYSQYKITHQSIKTFQAEGLVSIKTSTQADIAHFIWKQQDQKTSLEIYGPLGLGMTKIIKTPAGVILTTSNQQTYQAQDSEQLMKETLGWSVPIDGLNDWLLGIPENPINTYSLNSFGFLSILTEDTWEIHYLSYISIQKIPLPQKITLSSPEITITLVIQNWRLSK